MRTKILAFVAFVVAGCHALLALVQMINNMAYAFGHEAAPTAMPSSFSAEWAIVLAAVGCLLLRPSR